VCLLLWASEPLDLLVNMHRFCLGPSKTRAFLLLWTSEPLDLLINMHTFCLGPSKTRMFLLVWPNLGDWSPVLKQSLPQNTRVLLVWLNMGHWNPLLKQYLARITKIHISWGHVWCLFPIFSLCFAVFWGILVNKPRILRGVDVHCVINLVIY